MEPTLTFVYNIFQIIVYASIIAIGITLKIDRNYKAAPPVVGLFLIFLSDSVIIFMTEFLPDFMNWYDVNFIRTPSFKTVIFIGLGFFTLQYWSVVTGSSFSGTQGVLLSALGLWLIFVPLFGVGAIESFLFFSGYQIFCICVSIFALWKLRSIDPERLLIPVSRIRAFLVITIIFCLLIMIEDNYVIFFVDNYDAAAGELNIFYRNVSEDVLRFIYSGAALWIFFEQSAGNESDEPKRELLPGKIAPSSNPDAITDPLTEIELIQNPSEYKRMKFARELALTEREEEVFKLLLDGLSNQEISETLHISIGTVKAHVHGIFRKAKITHRYELPTLFESFIP